MTCGALAGAAASGCRSTRYCEIRMKKPDIAKRLALESGVSPAEAADRLDRVVREILAELRHGKDAALPGFGKFTRTASGLVRFRQDRND